MVKDLTLQHLKEQLSYDPETGVFTRLKTHKKSLISKEAGSVNSIGYRQISLHNYQFYAHRLAFFYMTGTWPKQQIDHINGNRLDNRWENLREVSNMENAQNRKGKGACLTPWGWCTQITTNYEKKHLGYFATAEEANAVYLEAKNKYHSKAMERKYGSPLQQ
jgi:hypothetical protein